MGMDLLFLPVAVIVLVVIILSNTLKVVPEWERLVVLRLGRIIGVKGPGLVFLFPFIDIPRRVDTRIITFDVPRQEAMTKDNVPTTIDAIVLFKVIDPNAAITRINNYQVTTSLIAQTTLRSIIGQVDLDQLLSSRDEINKRLQAVIDTQTEPYGVKVVGVEVRDVVLPDSMKRAMARQAESERERRAKVINAQGEYEASERLAQAAEMLSRQPASMQLRFLQTVSEMSSEKATTIVIPLPVDIMSMFLKGAVNNTPVPPVIPIPPVESMPDPNHLPPIEPLPDVIA